MKNLTNKLICLSKEHNGAKILSIKVRLGALSHMSPEHFLEHLSEFSSGSCFEKAKFEFIAETDIHDPQATGVYIESVEIENNFKNENKVNENF